MLHYSCFIYIVIMVIYVKIVVSRLCDVTCPQHKPYCSDVGCVSDCPAPFYINGTDCVMSCENLFVDQNRYCIDNCPVGTNVKETLQLIHAKQYLEKTCVVCGVDDGFIFINECVKTCPDSWKYVLMGGLHRCLQECPVELPYTNFVEGSGLLHGQCVETCTTLVDDGVCVTSCSDGKISYGKDCVDTCPVSAPYQYNEVCYTECPQMSFQYKTNNFSCVNMCPNERSYIMNNTCVDNCPKNFMYTKESNGFKYCVENCQENEMLIPDNNTCVDACPSLKVAFNNSCLDRCPQESILSCRTRKGQPCGNDPGSEEAHTVCVNLCPSNMFGWKNTCVYECPESVSRFERECTENCPMDRPYKINHFVTDKCHWFEMFKCESVQQILECTHECPSDYFMYNKSCLSYCPYPLVQYDSFCESKCPDNAPFQINSTVEVESLARDTNRKCGKVCFILWSIPCTV